MRNLIHILTILLLFSCFGEVKSKNKFEGQTLPSFNISLLPDSNKFNTEKIASGKPIVLFYFSPECSFCKSETEDIIKSIDSLSNVQFFFISPFPIDQIKNYHDYFQLKKFENISVGRDDDLFLEKHFQITQLPCTVFYTKDKLLKQVLIGNVAANVIKEIALN